MRKLLIATAIALLTSTAANAKIYDVDYANSTIEFAGKHAGKDFKGKFGEWNAQIDFDPEHLDTSSIKASFTTGTAVTGNKMYDGTLPSEDWFDAEKFPKADFVSTSIISKGGSNYIAEGTLTIRGIPKPAKIIFVLTDLSKSPVNVKAALVVNRLSYDIGKKSDAKAEWVNADIDITLNINATAK